MAAVLVAENVPDIAFGLNLVFTRAGHHTHVTATGPAALARVRDTPPDLLVMNPSLPGIDGLDVCRLLKAESGTAWLPILLISARYTGAEVAAARNAGADDYLAKPFGNIELLLRAETLLRRSAPRPSPAGLAQP